MTTEAGVSPKANDKVETIEVVEGDAGQRLDRWFRQQFPATKENRPQPRIMFKLRETDKKVVYEGTLSWSNGTCRFIRSGTRS